MTTLPTRFMASLRLRSTIVALALAATLASGVASGGTVQITDFSANIIGHAPWNWDQSQKVLNISGTSYLEQSNLSPTVLQGADVISLTATWDPFNPGGIRNGPFEVQFTNSVGIVASASFTYDQFKSLAPGTDQTHTSTLTFFQGSIRAFDLMLLIGTGTTAGQQPTGDLFLVSMSASSSSPVPEIDPAGIGSVLALVTGTLGILERRRSTSRRRATH